MNTNTKLVLGTASGLVFGLLVGVWGITGYEPSHREECGESIRHSIAQWNAPCLWPQHGYTTSPSVIHPFSGPDYTFVGHRYLSDQTITRSSSDSHIRKNGERIPLGAVWRLTAWMG